MIPREVHAALPGMEFSSRMNFFLLPFPFYDFFFWQAGALMFFRVAWRT